MKKITIIILFLSTAFTIHATRYAYDQKIRSLLYHYNGNPTQFSLRLRYYELYNQLASYEEESEQQHSKVLHRLIWAIDSLKKNEAQCAREKIEQAFSYIQQEQYDAAVKALEDKK